MEHYIYEGPVLNTNRVITEKWNGETYAVSEKRAIANLAYQFKRQYGLVKTSKIFLVYGVNKQND